MKIQLHLVKLGEPWHLDPHLWDGVTGFGTVYDDDGNPTAVIVAFIKRDAS